MKYRHTVYLAALGATVNLLRAQGPLPSPLASPAPPATPPRTRETSSTPHELTRADLEAFLDALIPSQLANRNFAGAVVGAVKDGQVLLTKGYGYADFKEKKPVLPAETLFRPGSISKLFTAVAVMQLVEQKKLDLDRDISDYLDFPIRKKFPEPITLRRLLTHTAGFEEVLKNLFVPDEKSLRPLRDYLINQMPAQIFPPGKVPSYSNYGLSLAGYIVQRVSGEKFEDYIANHILRPLQMAHSTFVQPLPRELAPLMANGYIEATQSAQKFELGEVAPAGALSATGADMCRFMLAILGGGTLEGATILQPGTIEQMQSHQFESHPELNALGLVFMEYTVNGTKAWGHGGDTLYFHSDLWLVPEAQFGFFISYNSAGPRPGGGRNEVMHALFERYFPKTVQSETAIDKATAKKDARDVSGFYITSRRGETTLLKVLTLLGQSTVSANADGTISVSDAQNLRRVAKRWREITPLVFHEVDGPEKIAFRRDATGRVTELLTQPPIWESQRAAWYDNQKFVLPLLGGSLLLLLLTVLLWPFAVIVRRRYRRPLYQDRRGKFLFRSIRIIALLEILWLIILAWLVSRAGSDISLLGDNLNPWLNFLHFFGWINAAGVVWMTVAAIVLWRQDAPGLWTKLHNTLIAAASLVLVCFLLHCHLLDPSLRF